MSSEFLHRLFSEPSLNGQVPHDVQFAPNSRHVSFLAPAEGDIQRLDLFAIDLETLAQRRIVDSANLDGAGVDAMTAEERAQRERRRAFATGVTGHAWLPDSDRLLLVAAGEAHLLELASGRIEQLTPPGTRQTDIRLTPSGRAVAYVRAGDLYLLDLETRTELRLTTDAETGVSNGLAEFVAQEEMHRFEGYWLSSDDRYVVHTRVDEREVAETLRYEMTAEEVRAIAQRYPFAGAANAQVTLWCIDRETDARVEIAWSEAADDYLARVGVGADAIWVQAQSRDQRRLCVKRFAFTGASLGTALTERHSTWLNLSDNLTFVPESDEFLWTSERDGAAQLYLGGRELQALTSTPGRVNSVVHASATAALVLGWRESATEQHLYRVPFADGAVEQVSGDPGWHDAVVSKDGRWWVDRVTRLDQPPALILRSLRDGTVKTLAGNALGPGHPYHPFLADHVTATLGTLEAEDGQQLNFRLTLPVGFDPTRRYPVLVNVYGGPGVQRVRNEWAPLSLQLFARAGMAVFELDNRGGGNRAKAFEDPIHGRLGHVEVHDQLTGVDHLKTLGWVDPERIGIVGHSYGGYMTLMCLARAPGTFRAGIAVAPVTDWRLYDTHYTERYLGTPQDNPEGYAASGVLAHLEALTAPLLVVHGMADDNVLFTNSTKLFKALQDRHQPFEMMTYPGAKHALQEPDVAIHRYQTMLDFLARELVA